MIVVRWSIDARFGHKDAVLELMQAWWDNIAPQIGWTVEQSRIITGSIGAAESLVQVEVTLDKLGVLHDAWTRLAEIPEQSQWADEMEPHIVSGSPRWEVLRIVR